MTDEAAFLKAIHDAPADDAPRLVFADWLDERSDARARFLREEVQAVNQFRAGKPAAAKKLRKSAHKFGLDWALSIARPPVGVCTAIRFKKSGKPVVAAALDAAAKLAGITLPPEYRVFLLQHNGGRPTPNQFTYEGEPEIVEELFPFKPKIGFVSVLEKYGGVMDDPSFLDLFASCLPIGLPGMADDCYALSTASKHFGAVVYQPFYIEGLRKPTRIADSFAGFLAMLGGN